ncbi:hypothetical protein TCAL_05843 [Tigriopus californicus]|uniref:SP-RING-type domain-containing protein n=2 Tax=Tigriopus californicus TaxID=6832 RepID=A0A553P7R3_TIGCA|nr:E3 SUMO-protein ligase PIAS2-like isoform X1 [Tigriopus californicus]TRY73722.1 hypothetical protein TCAL_05843 [Tigriopus californicus]
MAESDMLYSMVMGFRMSELQLLMAFAGKSKSGRKCELQSRALELININSSSMKLKIRELSNAMYSSLNSAASVNPYSHNFIGGGEDETMNSESTSIPPPVPTAPAVTSGSSRPSRDPSGSSGGGGGRTRRSAAVAAARALSRVSDVSPAESDQSSNGSDYSDSRSSSESAVSIVNSDSESSRSRSNTSRSKELTFTGQVNRKRTSQGASNGTSSKSSAAPKASAVVEESNNHLMYPTFPDVKLRELPFYKILAILMQPCALQPGGTARFQEQKFSFFLSPSQASEIASSSFRDSHGRVEYKKQIQMRFSLLETSCEQDDNFPASICVKVNNKIQPLPSPIPTNKPGVEPKRPPKPINITALCKLSSTMPNFLDVSWAVEIGRGFTVSIYYVDKLSAMDLMKELKDRGIRHPDYTRAIIKEKLNDKDVDVMTTSCKVTLACPLGKMRMSYPCRASTCDHLQCFDANLFLMMNERKPKWLCPVCNKNALFNNLLIDGFFNEVLKSSKLPPHDHEVVLHNDGSWEPLPFKKEGVSSKDEEAAAAAAATAAVKSPPVETLNLDDDESSSPAPTPVPATKTEKASSSSSSSSSSGEKATTSGSTSAAKTVVPVEGPSKAGNSTATTKSDKRSFDCITLDSDSEEDSETRPPNRKKPANELSSDKGAKSKDPPLPPSTPPLICLDD